MPKMLTGIQFCFWQRKMGITELSNSCLTTAHELMRGFEWETPL